MANVKKHAKNTLKGKTDEQITQSVSQTSIHPYKKRIILFSILSLASLTLAITSNETIFCLVLTFFFAWMATLMLILGSLFPNLNPHTETNGSFSTMQIYPVKDGIMTDYTGKIMTIHERYE